MNESPEGSIRLVLKGYLPASLNRLKGAHWTAEYREKQRAAFALESCLQSIVANPVIGTATPLSKYKTAWLNLVCWIQTTGINSKAKSSPKRFTRGKRRGRKS